VVESDPVSQPLTLRTETGDEHLDLPEFEARVRRGLISPQCLVRFPAVTGQAFVPACQLEIWRGLHEPKRAHFHRAFSLFRFPWLTSAIIVANLAVYLWSVREGPLDMDGMVRFGGKVGPMITDLGEYWRLLTANFLHRDYLHIGLNMFVLFNVGGALENAYRTLDYLFLLVVSGVCTMAVSLWLSPEAATMGASGMVFGCLGGVVVFGLKYRAILPELYRRILAEAAIPIVLVFLLIGWRSEGVDNAAHVGGLLAGVAVSPFLSPRLLLVGRSWSALARAAPSLAVLGAVMFGDAWLGTGLNDFRTRRDDGFGISVPVPSGWRPGANRFGQVAYFNGLPGLGRATFAAEAVLKEEPTDPSEQARAFVEETLQPRALGPEVLRVSALEPVSAKVADRESILVRARFEEPFGQTELYAYFVARGELLYQLVFSYPAAYPEYGRLVERMVAGLRFEEPKGLREARARALLFPNSGWALAELGEVLRRLGDPKLAAEPLQLAVKQEPAEVSYRSRLALSLLQSGQVEAGCKAAKGAMLYGPEHPGALEVDARCALAQGDKARALERITQARLRNPKDARLQRAESALREAIEEQRR
jgi:rhomboid protease GluP